MEKLNIKNDSSAWDSQRKTAPDKFRKAKNTLFKTIIIEVKTIEIRKRD